MYLKIILGNVNVSILNKNDKYVLFHVLLLTVISAALFIDLSHLLCRFRYKDEYEKFKLVLSVIGFVLSLLNLLLNVR